MKFADAYLFRTPDGSTVEARMRFNVPGGQREAPFPAGKEAPANAVSGTWNPETLTLSVLLDDASTQDLTLTPAEIAAI